MAADLHLSHRPPVARKDDWGEALRRPLRQLRKVANKYQVPTLLAGDLFHHWNEPASVVNLVIAEFSKFRHGVLAVPGQHDLPFHNYQNIKQSAYWTLVEAKVIEHLDPGKYPQGCGHGPLNVYPFPFGTPVTPLDGKGHDLCVGVALIHSYVWVKGYSFPDAPPEKRVKAYRRKLRGYDVAVFGDNHRHFRARVGDCVVYNCGCFLRRRSDESSFAPKVGLIHLDKTVSSVDLDCSGDVWGDPGDSFAAEEPDFAEMMEELRSMGDKALDFADSVRNYLESHNTSEPVKQWVLQALEGGKK